MEKELAIVLLEIKEELGLVKDFSDTVGMSRQYHAGYVAGLEKAERFVREFAN